MAPRYNCSRVAGVFNSVYFYDSDFLSNRSKVEPTMVFGGLGAAVVNDYGSA